MNDFKSFSNAKNTKASGGAANTRCTESTGGTTNVGGAGKEQTDGAALNNTVEMAKIISKAMNGKNTTQIMQTIIAEAERGKREGTLTNADLDNFYAALSPLLDGFKKRKLKEVIARLKAI